MMIKKKKLIRKMVTKVMIIKETEKNINGNTINIKHCKRLRPNIYKIRSPSHIKKTLFVVFLDFEF